MSNACDFSNRDKRELTGFIWRCLHEPFSHYWLTPNFPATLIPWEAVRITTRMNSTSYFSQSQWESHTLGVGDWKVNITTSPVLPHTLKCLTTTLFILCIYNRNTPWCSCWEPLVKQMGNAIQHSNKMHWECRWSLEYARAELAIHVPYSIVRFPRRRYSWRPDSLYHYR